MNSELRLKSIYCQRLEVLVCKRNETIDQLIAKLDQLRGQYKALEIECDRWANLYTISAQNKALITADNAQ